MSAFMFASISTPLAITVDRYVYILKPLKYHQILTHRRVSLAISVIWITACCLFVVHYIHDRSHVIEIRSLCYIPDSIYYFAEVGRSMWPIFVQFRCPHSGTTFSLHDSIDFYVLNTDSLVVTSRNPQFFCNLRSKYWYFYLNYVWKLHVFYNFCTSPSLLAGGFYAITCIFVLFWLSCL